MGGILFLVFSADAFFARVDCTETRDDFVRVGLCQCRNATLVCLVGGHRADGDFEAPD